MVRGNEYLEKLKRLFSVYDGTYITHDMSVDVKTSSDNNKEE
jgi:hypothetical protein